MSDHPWLVVTSERKGTEVSGRRRHYIKLLEPSFGEEGQVNNPKGRLSPGEGLVKMVRVLLVRPDGEAAPLGVRGAAAQGEGLWRKRARWH